MGKIMKKFTRGAATNYVTRNQALRRLQISLKDFRRLCILKGIYPAEPKHKKKANKGSSAPRTFYIAKDIQFLAHEKIINKFRAYKVFLRKLKRATDKGDRLSARRIKEAKPKYKLDHIVKERYPTFQDALADLDDCLSMLFLYATIPNIKVVDAKILRQCRRLTVEFMHYVMKKKALKKVFVSIKGVYFQAEIQGHLLTWVIPHNTSGSYKSPQDVDFKIMSTFVEFYVTLMGFVNYKLYQSIDLIYPPKLRDTVDSKENTKGLCLSSDYNCESIASLNRDLACDGDDVGDEIVGDDFGEIINEGESEEDRESRMKRREEMAAEEKLKSLFSGLKFYVGREVNRETLVFLIRSFGGSASWDAVLAIGATFAEEDPSITHQIVDRPDVRNRVLTRTYLQPQWVFDCVNARMLLPVKNYFPGSPLPPHLSPFVEEREGDYVPLEKKRLERLQSGEVEELDEKVRDRSEEDDSEEAEEDDEEDEEEDDDDEEQENDGDELMLHDSGKEVEEDEDSSSEDGSDEAPKLKRAKLDPAASEKKSRTKQEELENMVVTAAAPRKNDSQELDFQASIEERKLREMMIPKKRKRLYEKIVKGKKKRTAGAARLEEKRKNYESLRASKLKRS